MLINPKSLYLALRINSTSPLRTDSFLARLRTCLENTVVRRMCLLPTDIANIPVAGAGPGALGKLRRLAPCNY